MKNIKGLFIEICENVCSSCYPDARKQVYKLAPHLIAENGGWIGGYTREKHEEFKAISDEFLKDKKSTCFTLDCDYGVYVCKKCLQEIIDQM